MHTEADIDLNKITFRCGTCNDELKVSDDGDAVVVSACETCLANAEQQGYDNGHSDGNSEGYDRGYEEGKVEGFQEGSEAADKDPLE